MEAFKKSCFCVFRSILRLFKGQRGFLNDIDGTLLLGVAERWNAETVAHFGNLDNLSPEEMLEHYEGGFYLNDPRLREMEGYDEFALSLRKNEDAHTDLEPAPGSVEALQVVNEATQGQCYSFLNTIRCETIFSVTAAELENGGFDPTYIFMADKEEDCHAATQSKIESIVYAYRKGMVAIIEDSTSVTKGLAEKNYPGTVLLYRTKKPEGVDHINVIEFSDFAELPDLLIPVLLG